MMRTAIVILGAMVLAVLGRKFGGSEMSQDSAHMFFGSAIASLTTCLGALWFVIGGWKKARYAAAFWFVAFLPVLLVGGKGYTFGIGMGIGTVIGPVVALLMIFRRDKNENEER